jgi:hypothetical protein
MLQRVFTADLDPVRLAAAERKAAAAASLSPGRPAGGQAAGGQAGG